MMPQVNILADSLVSVTIIANEYIWYFGILSYVIKAV